MERKKGEDGRLKISKRTGSLGEERWEEEVELFTRRKRVSGNTTDQRGEIVAPRMSYACGPLTRFACNGPSDLKR
jgi:hypothetical protein